MKIERDIVKSYIKMYRKRKEMKFKIINIYDGCGLLKMGRD